MSTAPTQSYNSIKWDETRFLYDQQSSESKLESWNRCWQDNWNDVVRSLTCPLVFVKKSWFHKNRLWKSEYPWWWEKHVPVLEASSFRDFPQMQILDRIIKNEVQQREKTCKAHHLQNFG